MKSYTLKGLYVKIRNHDKFKSVKITDGVKFPLNKSKFGHRLFTKLSFTYNDKKYDIYSNTYTNLITSPNCKNYEYFPKEQLRDLRAFKAYMDMGFKNL